MMALVALLFAAATPCDVGPLLRAVAKSSLPPRTARNVTAKVQYAATMCMLGPNAPTTPAEELRIARTMAAGNGAVTAEIDRTIRALAEENDVPARLTIRMRHTFFTIDGVSFQPYRPSVTLPLRAGTHQVDATPVTLAEGEPRTIEQAEPNADPPWPSHWLNANVAIATADGLDKLCFSAVRAADGERVAMKSIERITLEKRGTFEATDLFAISDDGALCVADVAALREIVREPGPLGVHVAGGDANGARVDVDAGIGFGREIVIRGSVAEDASVVSAVPFSAPVKDGRFTLKLPEGYHTLTAYRDERHAVLSTNIELHCDAEVRWTREKLEVVKGGCQDAPSWMPRRVADVEELQAVEFDFHDGAVKPLRRVRHHAEPLESESEETLQRYGTSPGILLIRAYGDNGVLVHRAIQRIELHGGDMGPTTWFSIPLPLTARTIEIKGWTPATSGRWEIAEILKP